MAAAKNAPQAVMALINFGEQTYSKMKRVHRQGRESGNDDYRDNQQWIVSSSLPEAGSSAHNGR